MCAQDAGQASPIETLAEFFPSFSAYTDQIRAGEWMLRVTTATTRHASPHGATVREAALRPMARRS
ncbi:conserved protein of unknown function [Rhodovastum atsumiense]|uniref:Uncharacterized protein n=1 Tax=Rhodovastum atsumiense TaxID=504468 RepID=A0A5M6ING6_9PROT|nr:hypothetical protein [Rhodovastum atsumiense]KAA5609813.1 hypothetical protein F1189_22235 [Rhodovastum atsumiense]CAH2603718.1 conserved protein of unknown function [Rhodovastum atsumiense]